jgi:hypothetical protein
VSDTSPELPPVLLGPESGRNVAEHIELFGKTEQFPDPRDEAVGLLRDIKQLFDRGCGIHPCGTVHTQVRNILARIDK